MGNSEFLLFKYSKESWWLLNQNFGKKKSLERSQRETERKKNSEPSTTSLSLVCCLNLSFQSRNFILTMWLWRTIHFMWWVHSWFHASVCVIKNTLYDTPKFGQTILYQTQKNLLDKIHFVSSTLSFNLDLPDNGHPVTLRYWRFGNNRNNPFTSSSEKSKPDTSRALKKE